MKCIPKNLLKCFCCEEVSLQIVPTQFFAFSECFGKIRECLDSEKGVGGEGDMGEWIMIVTRRNEIGGCHKKDL